MKTTHQDAKGSTQNGKAKYGRPGYVSVCNTSQWRRIWKLFMQGEEVYIKRLDEDQVQVVAGVFAGQNHQLMRVEPREPIFPLHLIEWVELFGSRDLEERLKEINAHFQWMNRRVRIHAYVKA